MSARCGRLYIDQKPPFRIGGSWPAGNVSTYFSPALALSIVAPT